MEERRSSPSSRGDSASRYLFTGGGTGGHVTPNLAIIGALRADDPGARFLYAGTRRGFESRVVESGVPFVAVPCAPLASPRKVGRFLAMALRITVGVFVGGWHILRFRPHVVIASGGYVSVPTVLAAKILRRRIYVHEQNVDPGRANRLLGTIATRVGVTFPKSLGSFRRGQAIHTGYPVRAQIQAMDKAEARRRLEIADDQRVAFIVGGSMGARSINRGTIDAMPQLLQAEGLTVIHATGLAQTSEYHAHADTTTRLRARGIDPEDSPQYQCSPFFQEIGTVYAAADLVVARAGAGTIMELAALGKPALLVPKSGVPGEHQLRNALTMQESGSAEVLYEKYSDEQPDLTQVAGTDLAARIRSLLGDPDKLTRMGQAALDSAVPDSLARHAGVIRELREGSPSPKTESATDRVAHLIDPSGEEHEVLFRVHRIGTSRHADLRYSRASGEPRTETCITRNRVDGETRYTLHPRSGDLRLDGRLVDAPKLLEEGQVISLGGRTWTFQQRDHAIRRAVGSRALGLPALMTGCGVFASRVFGFVRDLILAVAFGAGQVADLWFLGLGVANWLRGVFAELAIESAFLPTYLHLLRTGRTDRARKLLGSMLTITLVGTGALSMVGILTMPAWLPLVASEFPKRGIMEDAIFVTRLMFPYLVLVSLAAIASALLRAAERYALPAFSSIFFSVGAIFGFALYPWLGVGAMGLGVLLGGLGQLLVQIPTLTSRGVRSRLGMEHSGPAVAMSDPAVAKVRRLTPVILGEVAILKVGLLVDLALAGRIGVGSMAALGLALALFRLPFGVIGQSVNLVVLRRASDLQADADAQATRNLLVKAVHWSCFLLLPASVLMVVLAEPLVRLLLQYGRFTPEDTLRVATTLQALSIGLLALGLHNLFGRILHARLEQRVATRTSFVCLVANVVLSVTLVAWGAGLFGIAIATSLSYFLGAGLRLLAVSRSLRVDASQCPRREIHMLLVRHAIAVVPVAAVTLAARDAVAGYEQAPTFLARTFEFLVPALFGAGAYLASAVLLRLPALRELEERFTRAEDRKAPRASAPINPYCLEPPQRLLRWVQANPNTAKSFELSARVIRLLKARNWAYRNTAVKLAAAIGDPALVLPLTHLVRCRNAAPIMHRILGGDFEEPGFVRRNAVQALTSIGAVDSEVESALLAALDDPYWEVRTAAARAIGQLQERISPTCLDRAERRMRRLCRGRNFEVAQEATRTLGTIAQSKDVLPVLARLHYHRNWRVRHALIEAYSRLFERGIIRDADWLRERLDDVLITSEGFVPRFELKERLSRIQEQLREPKLENGP